MRRVAFLLSLIAAMTGTPLRQAEAASDAGRMLSNLILPDHLESTDGGVGDDSGVTLQSGSETGLSGDWLPAFDTLLLPPSLLLVSLSPVEAAGLHERVWWPPQPPNSRYAWLQIFLF